MLWDINKMHLMLLTRGNINEVRKFINSLNETWLNHMSDYTSEKPEERFTQINVQPIQLWSIVFPEEHKDIILNSILEGGNGDFVPHMKKKYQFFANMLRRLMKLKPIPEYKKDKKYETIYTPNVQKITIGIKEDYKKENGVEGL